MGQHWHLVLICKMRELKRMLSLINFNVLQTGLGLFSFKGGSILITALPSDPLSVLLP